MGKCKRFSSYVGLAAVGIHMRLQGIWETVEKRVTITQKVISHKPTDKLMDALMTILSGSCGLGEVNTRVPMAVGLQRALGRAGCAEQLVVSETLNCCQPATVQHTLQDQALVRPPSNK